MCGEWGVCSMFGACVGVCGRAWGVCVGQKVLVSLTPLYYPDTLVNPDTCILRLILSNFGLPPILSNFLLHILNNS